MALSKCFLSLQNEDKEKCLLCEGALTTSSKCTVFRNDGWVKLKEQAKDWSRLNVHFEDKIYPLIKVHEKINSKQDAYGKAHVSCRTSFRTHLERATKRYGFVETEPNISTVDSPEKVPWVSRRSVGQHLAEKMLCFICNTKRICETSPYNQGGIGRCTEERAANKLLKRKDEYLKDKSHRYHTAANRLELILSGKSHDIFAVDVYYHNSCYLKFAVNANTKLGEKNEIEEEIAADVLKEFLGKMKMKVLREKNAYLLRELLEDLKNMSEENGVIPIVKHTVELKRRILEEFEDKISFYPTGRQVIVYSSDVNPCDYSESTLKGHGLRENDLIRAFAKMVKGKNEKRRKDESQWPFTPEQLLTNLDSGPLPDLYNIIYATIDPNFKINKYGYSVTRSDQMATKVWSVASDWEALLTQGKKSPKQVVTGLTLHRMTGSKSVVTMMNKMGNCLSYNDIRVQNQAWARMVSSKTSVARNLAKGIATHATIDNNDGRQETATGKGTTHDTNCTIFQPLLPGKI